MASTGLSSGQSLASLLRQTSLDDHEEVLKAANAALRKSKDDVEAQHVKAVALLKLDRYEDALGVLEGSGEKLRAKARLERAYALYKVGKFSEAEEVAADAKGARGPQHVEAQAAYRLENFQRSAEIYQRLASKGVDGQSEENDLRINGSATSAQLEWAGQGHLVRNKAPSRDDLDAFETAYNWACASIARGQLAQGAAWLRRARDLCNASEDLSDEEKKAEVLPIAVQQIYVLSRLGKLEEAEKLSSELSVQDIPDLSTRQIAQINVIESSPQTPNPYLAHRLFHAIPPLPKTAQPFDVQASILRRNAYALDLLSLKYGGVARSTSEFLSGQPSPTISAGVNSISVISAAAHAQSQLGKAGLKKILPLLEKRPKDVGLVLTAIQLYMQSGNYGSAVSLLDSFLPRLEDSTTPADQAIRFAPGLVAVAVSLYAVQGRTAHINAELAKAASYWRDTSEEARSLLLAAGKTLLLSSKDEEQQMADTIFSSLHGQDPNNRLVIAGYVASNAMASPDLVEPKLELLSPVERLTAGVDVAALLRAGIARPPAPSVVPSSKKRAAEGAVKPAKKRVRKSRLPKDYDASKPADPERWLPLRDRSTYRPKGKKGKQKQAALTQGGFSAGAEERAASTGGAAVVKSEKAPGGGSGGGAKAKKKKGKGGKW
ncbi:MAG: Signal recognition particle core component [Thelocarpon impressellum]|nr:MAG: Signal recognition particle core component [Thelocarpon impressellum]